MSQLYILGIRSCSEENRVLVGARSANLQWMKGPQW